jgi:hypothetical protein
LSTILARAPTGELAIIALQTPPNPKWWHASPADSSHETSARHAALSQFKSL